MLASLRFHWRTNLAVACGVAAGTAVQLRAARFGRVNQLAILVADNQGGDEDEATVVASIRLAGSAGETFDVNAIKKVEEA